MDTSELAIWPRTTAPSFVGSQRDGNDVYELFDAAPADDGTPLVALYLRQSNGLWPCRSIVHGPGELRNHFTNVLTAWAERAKEIVDHRADKSIPLPVCQAKPDNDSVDNPRPFYPSFNIPPRRRYKSGRLREITKAESDAFNAALRSILAPFPTDDEGLGGWTVQTDFGPLHVSKPYSQHSLYYCVYTRFTGTRADLARAVARFGDHAVNGYSGKWNILETEGDDALNLLCVQLDAVNALATVRVAV